MSVLVVLKVIDKFGPQKRNKTEIMPMYQVESNTIRTLSTGEHFIMWTEFNEKTSRQSHYFECYKTGNKFSMIISYYDYYTFKIDISVLKFTE